MDKEVLYHRQVQYKMLNEIEQSDKILISKTKRFIKD